MASIVTIPKNEKAGRIQVIRLLEQLHETSSRASYETPEVGPLRTFFSGEFDSQQTTFEEMSNQLEIGVVARSEKVGCVLLTLLRVIIDERPDLIWPDIEKDEEEGYETWPKDLPRDGKKAPLDWWITQLARSESGYLSSFLIDSEYSCTLLSVHPERTLETNREIIETVIKKRFEDVDIWTLARIEKAILEIYTT